VKLPAKSTPVQKIVYNKEFMHNLYNGSAEDIYFVLSEFIKEAAFVKEQMLNSYLADNPVELSAGLHKHYAGFTYAGFPQISIQIKELLEKCKYIKRVSEINDDFTRLLIAVDECSQVCQQQLVVYQMLQNASAP
jgi:hypothetical protein